MCLPCNDELSLRHAAEYYHVQIHRAPWPLRTNRTRATTLFFAPVTPLTHPYYTVRPVQLVRPPSIHHHAVPHFFRAVTWVSDKTMDQTFTLRQNFGLALPAQGYSWT